MRRFACLGSIALLLGLPVVSAEELAFRRHVLNADAEFSACAVIDVNGDGRPDIFSGGFWYEGPTWKRHKARDVEMIGNRYDDYSNLPLDVDGDGWTDIISVNYRSRSLYWVRHPGPAGGDWAKHVIDTPGPSETGRLVDVDSDGQLDVLPDGTKFAAWYQTHLASRRRWLPPTAMDPSPVARRHDRPRDRLRRRQRRRTQRSAESQGLGGSRGRHIREHRNWGRRDREKQTASFVGAGTTPSVCIATVEP